MSDETKKPQPPKSQVPTAQVQASSAVTQFGMEVAPMPRLTLATAAPAVEKTTVEKLLQKLKDL
jgi:hypothetical protein